MQFRYQVIESVYGDWTLRGTYDVRADAEYHAAKLRQEYRRQRTEKSAPFVYLVCTVKVEKGGS
jgi:hypothetical protein